MACHTSHSSKHKLQSRNQECKVCQSGLPTTRVPVEFTAQCLHCKKTNPFGSVLSNNLFCAGTSEKIIAPVWYLFLTSSVCLCKGKSPKMSIIAWEKWCKFHGFVVVKKERKKYCGY